jgi:hypothetical protein
MGVSLGRNGLARAAEFSPPVYIAQIILHKAHEPDSSFYFFDADGLTNQRTAEIDFLAIQAQAAAVGDDDGLVVERVRFHNSLGRVWQKSFHGGRPIRYGSLCLLVDDNAHAMPALVGCDLQISFRRCPMLALVALIT